MKSLEELKVIRDRMQSQIGPRCGVGETAPEHVEGDGPEKFIMVCGGSSDEDYLDLLTRCFDIPIIRNCDIGHVKPCMTLINGSFARVQSGDGIGTIEMRLE